MKVAMFAHKTDWLVLKIQEEFKKIYNKDVEIYIGNEFDLNQDDILADQSKTDFVDYGLVIFHPESESLQDLKKTLSDCPILISIPSLLQQSNLEHYVRQVFIDAKRHQDVSFLRVISDEMPRDESEPSITFRM